MVYEYANRLAADGYVVKIIYPSSLFFRKTPFKHKLAIVLKYPYNWISKSFSGNNWFKLDDRVKEIFVPALSFRYIPKSDYYVATSVETAIYARNYPVDRNKIIYFIQDFENWRFPDNVVVDTYKEGFQNVVISQWLKRIMTENNIKCEVLPNGFDFDYFKKTVPEDKRDPYHMSMLYHPGKHKGCNYGLQVFERLKALHKELRVTLFGFPDRPENIPVWIDYIKSPDKEKHNLIYNSSSIFVAPSIAEGWGLTVGEAMICGACVVCTEAGGFGEMVTHGVTGMISPVKDVDMMVKNIEYLIENPYKRIEMAKMGNQHIRQFTWERSYAKLKCILGGLT